MSNKNKNGTPQDFQKQLTGMTEGEFLKSYNKSLKEEKVMRGCFWGFVGMGGLIFLTVFVKYLFF